MAHQQARFRRQLEDQKRLLEEHALNALKNEAWTTVAGGKDDPVQRLHEIESEFKQYRDAHEAMVSMYEAEVQNLRLQASSAPTVTVRPAIPVAVRPSNNRKFLPRSRAGVRRRDDEEASMSHVEILKHTPILI